MLKVLVIASILTFTMPGCALFAGGRPTVTTQRAGCSSLIPNSWRARVPGADLPSENTVGAWETFADAQTGRLDQANDRTVASIEIVSACEARDAEAVGRATGGLFRRLFGG